MTDYASLALHIESKRLEEKINTKIKQYLRVQNIFVSRNLSGPNSLFSLVIWFLASNTFGFIGAFDII